MIQLLFWPDAAAVVRALDEAEKVQPGATREDLEGETKKPEAECDFAHLGGCGRCYKCAGDAP